MTIATTDRLVTHIANVTRADLEEADIEKAKVFLLDTLGVGIAGSSGANVAELLATVRGWGNGDSEHHRWNIPPAHLSEYIGNAHAPGLWSELPCGLPFPW